MKTSKRIKLFGLFIFSISINSHGQCWKSISANQNHVLAIKQDGSLWAWGYNVSGSIGDGTTITPVRIGASTNWKQVSSGHGTSAAIKDDGTLWTWGAQFGQDISVPTQLGNETNWYSVGCGVRFVVALKKINNSITLWTWGINQFGQLGDGTFTSRYAPQQIGTSVHWKSISVGSEHVVALEYYIGFGTRLKTWGLNNFGQLGDGTFINRNIPTQIGIDYTWNTVKTARYHNIARKSNGTLWGWGINNDGQLGIGNNVNKNIPIQIGTDTNWQNVITTGGRHTMVKKSNGTLWTWGNNTFGQMGNGGNISSTIPQQMGTLTSWGNIISSSGVGSFGINTNNQLYFWGNAISVSGTPQSNVPMQIFCNNVIAKNVENEEELVLKNKIYSSFPNPFSAVLKIHVADDKKIGLITITDLFGKVVYHQNNPSDSIDLETLSKGIYIMQLTINDTTYQEKIVKQ